MNKNDEFSLVYMPMRGTPHLVYSGLSRQSADETAKTMNDHLGEDDPNRYIVILDNTHKNTLHVSEDYDGFTDW